MDGEKFKDQCSDISKEFNIQIPCKLAERVESYASANELKLDEIRALRFAEEGSVEKEIFWELQEVARQKKETDDFFNQMKYQKKLWRKKEVEEFIKQMENNL